MLQPLVSALLGVGRALVMLQPLVSALLGVGRALVMLQPLVSALLGVGRSVSALLVLTEGTCSRAGAVCGGIWRLLQQYLEADLHLQRRE
ncbi:hypothetical protein WMY93_019622 [Mugilogobius chulae]|uniref:Uncharacterized protein n=1 Tax=Mugilogobius chulae TaxID=88201 RepID=A0AAW0NIX8_9GOBI